MNAPAAMIRAALPEWPRLMGEDMAAAYLGVGRSFLREHGPKPKKWRGRTLWDRRDLDRCADALDGQPLDADEEAAESAEVERRFLERRARQRG